MTIKDKVKKFLHQSGVLYEGEGEKTLKKIYPDDKLYNVWESSIIRLAERIAREEREDILNEIKNLPTGMFDSGPYLSEIIEKLNK